MKKLSIVVSTDKLTYFEKACKEGMMKITNINQTKDKSIYEVDIEYDPGMLELIFSEIFYAGIYYGLDKNKK